MLLSTFKIFQLANVSI